MKDKDIEKIMKSLANKRRIAIIRLLNDKKEMTVSDISEQIKLSFKSTSKHLSILSFADIVEKEQRSSQSFYSLSNNLPELVHKIFLFL